MLQIVGKINKSIYEMFTSIMTTKWYSATEVGSYKWLNKYCADAIIIIAGGRTITSEFYDIYELSLHSRYTCWYHRVLFQIISSSKSPPPTCPNNQINRVTLRTKPTLGVKTVEDPGHCLLLCVVHC